MSEINDALPELPFKTGKIAWEKWINNEGQQYLGMNRIISVAQIEMFLRSAFEAGFNANTKAYNALIRQMERSYKNELEFIGKMPVQK